LFQYVNDDGECCSVTSDDVNAYLKEIAGADFTTKDFGLGPRLYSQPMR
jgi:DNA topoisomerase-1